MDYPLNILKNEIDSNKNPAFMKLNCLLLTFPATIILLAYETTNSKILNGCKIQISKQSSK